MRANGITPLDNQCTTLNSQHKQTYYGWAHSWQTSQIATFAFSIGGCFQPYVVSGTHACAIDDYFVYPEVFQLNDCRDYGVNGGDQRVAEQDFQEGSFVITSSDWMRMTCDKFGNVSYSQY